MSRRVARHKERQAGKPQMDDEKPSAVRIKRGEKSDAISFHSEFQQPAQNVIRLFKECFQEFLGDAEHCQEQIQIVKGDLFNRDYNLAFGDETRRSAYVVRWSPARALCYSSFFSHLPAVRSSLADFSKESINVLGVGAGAGAELVAFISLFSRARELEPYSTSRLDLKLVDIADWTNIVDNISNWCSSHWLENTSAIQTSFLQADVLKETPLRLQLSQQDLITLLFTTNELFAADKNGSIKFLHLLSQHCKNGAHLLMAESAGSYSFIDVGQKKFPIFFLVDTILCGPAGTNKGAWDLVDSNDSIWFRIDEELNYPIKLENMRFFYRLYRKK